MTTSTTDPMVALVYGVLAYPSLRPGVTTAADLVGGQPGPWDLADDDRAALATALVDRLRHDDPIVEVAVAAAGNVIDQCRVA